MQAILPLAIVAFALAMPMTVHGAADTVLVAWVPTDSALPYASTYTVYGVSGETWTFLGATQHTAFEAPAGYAGYDVKVRDVDGERDVDLPCVTLDPEEPSVSWELSC